MMIKDEILTRLHRVEARLCAVEAKVDDCAAAEFQQQPVRAAGQLRLWVFVELEVRGSRLMWRRQQQ